MDNDPRITPIGRFIRKTSLDELPQFFNVLKGDMSLVGTRPPTVDEYEKYTPEQKRRLSFKPGITGLWQVSGRSEITDFDEVVRLDVSYIDDWTIWSDIKILLKTIKVVFKREWSEVGNSCSSFPCKEKMKQSVYIVGSKGNSSEIWWF